MGGDKKYNIVEHAKIQMKSRGIFCEEVTSCLENPGQVVPAGEEKIIYQKIIPLNGKMHLLRIVVERGRNVLNVVTVYKTSKVNKYWK